MSSSHIIKKPLKMRGNFITDFVLNHLVGNFAVKPKKHPNGDTKKFSQADG
jgi:hypothetical protein